MAFSTSLHKRISDHLAVTDLSIGSPWHECERLANSCRLTKGKSICSLFIQWQLIKSEKDEEKWRKPSFYYNLAFLKNFKCRLSKQSIYLYHFSHCWNTGLNRLEFKFSYCHFNSYMICDTLLRLCDPQFCHP